MPFGAVPDKSLLKGNFLGLSWCVPSRKYVQLRECSLKFVPSGIRYLAPVEKHFFELGEFSKWHEPGVGDLRAGEVVLARMICRELSVPEIGRADESR